MDSGNDHPSGIEEREGEETRVRRSQEQDTEVGAWRVSASSRFTAAGSCAVSPCQLHHHCSPCTWHHGAPPYAVGLLLKQWHEAAEHNNRTRLFSIGGILPRCAAE